MWLAAEGGEGTETAWAGLACADAFVLSLEFTLSEVEGKGGEGLPGVEDLGDEIDEVGMELFVALLSVVEDGLTLSSAPLGREGDDGLVVGLAEELDVVEGRGEEDPT